MISHGNMYKKRLFANNMDLSLSISVSVCNMDISVLQQ